MESSEIFLLHICNIPYGYLQNIFSFQDKHCTWGRYKKMAWSISLYNGVVHNRLEIIFFFAYLENILIFLVVPYVLHKLACVCVLGEFCFENEIL